MDVERDRTSKGCCVDFVEISIVNKLELDLQNTPGMFKEVCRPIAKTLGDRLKYYRSKISSLLKKRKFIYRTVRNYR